MLKTRLKTVFAVSLIIGLVGCGKTEEVTVTITRIETESTKWGCIGTDKRTFVKTDDGRVAYICNEWGKPGEQIKGYWKTGHPDSAVNGFRIAN
jgi:Ni2+-binding GTPase involved in maturation of urease and hydrogenase